MKIHLENVNTSGNGGDGVHIAGEADVYIKNFRADNNGGTGLVVINKDSVYEFLGLPKEINPELIRSVLHEISARQDGSTAEDIARQSGLIEKISAAGLNTSSFLVNLTTLAANPYIQRIISALGG